jgi:hypothetical protein
MIYILKDNFKIQVLRRKFVADSVGFCGGKNKTP